MLATEKAGANTVASECALSQPYIVHPRVGCWRKGGTECFRFAVESGRYDAWLASYGRLKNGQRQQSLRTKLTKHKAG